MIRSNLFAKYSFVLLLSITILCFQSCNNDDAVKAPDDSGTIDLNDKKKVIETIVIDNSTTIYNSMPSPSANINAPEISFSEIIADGVSKISKSYQHPNENISSNDINKVSTSICQVGKTDKSSLFEKGDKVLNNYSSDETIVVQQGGSISISINVLPLNIQSFEPCFNIGMKDENTYKKIYNFQYSSGIANFNLTIPETIRPGILNININLCMFYYDETLTSNIITLNVIIVGKVDNSMLSNLSGTWEIIKQAPTAGTLIDLGYYMPDYIGGNLKYNSNGTGVDNSIINNPVDFLYKIIQENEKYLLDCFEIPIGSGIDGAKYYILTCNKTSLILNEKSTFYTVKRYIECRRK